MGDRGQYATETDAPDIRVERVRFQTNNTSDPAAANTYDPGKIVSTIARIDTGRIRVTLRERFTRIYATVNLESTNGAHGVQVYNYVEDSATCYVELLTTSTMSDADLTDIPVTLKLDLES